MSISEYVEQDLRSRLRSGQELPTELTLEWLADHYEVSITPVRAAVAELVTKGILLKGANRRLISAPDASDAHRDPTTVSGESIPEPPRDLLKVVERDLVH